MSRAGRLYAYIMQSQHQQFMLGVHDCAIFVCKWVDQELGTNYLERVTKDLNYGVESHAVRAIAKRGGYDLLVERYCGTPQDIFKGPYTAGDIALYTNTFNNLALGLIGEHLVYGPGMDGIVATDIVKVTKFWRLECLQQPQR